jgi:hypothetical protein
MIPAYAQISVYTHMFVTMNNTYSILIMINNSFIIEIIII